MPDPASPTDGARRAAPSVATAAPVRARPASGLLPWLAAGALWVVALHAALFWLDRAPAPRRLWGDEITYQAAADRLLAGLPADLDPLWPPLYPHAVAWLRAWAGGALAPVKVGQTLLLALAALALWDLGRRLFAGSPAAGPASGIAAWLLLADPQVAAFAHYLWPEALHLALFLGVLWILVARPDRPAWLAAAGLALGLALLTKSLLGPFLPVLLLPLALQGGWRRGLPRAALVLSVLAAMVAPAMLASRREGRGLTIADSSRFNLWVGLNDRSRKSFVGEIVGEEYDRYRASAPTFAARNAILGAKIRGLLRERSPAALLAAQLARQPFRLFDRDSFLTDQLPGGAIAVQGYGYAAVPAPLAAALRAASYGLYAAVLVAASFGIAASPARGRSWLWVILAFLAYNLAIFLLLHVKSRYRIQFLPFLYLFAGYAVALRRAGGLRLSPRDRLAAAGAAALALFLAFAGPWLDAWGGGG